MGTWRFFQRRKKSLEVDKASRGEREREKRAEKKKREEAKSRARCSHFSHDSEKEERFWKSIFSFSLFSFAFLSLSPLISSLLSSVRE